MDDKPEDKNIRFLLSEYLRLKDSIDFQAAEQVELDLGCGNGSFTTALAQRYPEHLILAADILIGRLRKLVNRNRRAGVDNIKSLRVEARQLLSYMLHDNSINRLHILCPDPWPKGRHRGNRLLCSDFMENIYRILAQDGVFHFATDDDYYYETVCRLVETSELFTEKMSLYSDIADIKSDFERRWISQGKTVRHITWQKKKI
jgi:tRNA (guanine-N7-)-methyltransferase